MEEPEEIQKYYEIEEPEREKPSYYEYEDPVFLGKLVFAAEEQQQVDLLEQAFVALDGAQRDGEFDIETFNSRWGGIDQHAIKRALQEGEGEHFLVAIFALGLMQNAQDAAPLYAFLSSTNQRVRWASALSLGRKKDPAALPILKTMLEEDLASPPQWGWDEASWFFLYRSRAAHILAELDEPEALSLLYNALVQTYQLIHNFRQRMSWFDDNILRLWWSYQDTLIYTLGQLGAFGAVTSLPYTQSHLHFCYVLLVLGNLRVTNFYISNIRAGWESEERIRSRVCALLAQQFGLTEDEQKTYLDDFKEYFQERFFSPDPFWGLLEGAEEAFL